MWMGADIHTQNVIYNRQYRFENMSHHLRYQGRCHMRYIILFAIRCSCIMVDRHSMMTMVNRICMMVYRSLLLDIMGPDIIYQYHTPVSCYVVLFITKWLHGDNKKVVLLGIQLKRWEVSPLNKGTPYLIWRSSYWHRPQPCSPLVAS